MLGAEGEYTVGVVLSPGLTRLGSAALDCSWEHREHAFTKFCCAFPQMLSKWRRRKRGLIQKLTNTHIQLHNNKSRRITLTQTQTNMHTSQTIKMPNIFISQT